MSCCCCLGFVGSLVSSFSFSLVNLLAEIVLATGGVEFFCFFDWSDLLSIVAFETPADI